MGGLAAHWVNLSGAIAPATDVAPLPGPYCPPLGHRLFILMGRAGFEPA